MIGLAHFAGTMLHTKSDYRVGKRVFLEERAAPPTPHFFQAINRTWYHSAYVPAMYKTRTRREFRIESVLAATTLSYVDWIRRPIRPEQCRSGASQRRNPECGAVEIVHVCQGKFLGIHAIQAIEARLGDSILGDVFPGIRAHLASQRQLLYAELDIERQAEG